MKSTTFNWKTKDQLDVHAIDWVPEGGYKAVIALVHGFGEHCERYHHVADFYGKHGYAMTSYDHRGHGKSGGKRGHTPNYDAFLDGIDDLLKYTAEKHPGKPIVLYGHSMGGNLVLNYMLRRKPNVKAVVASAPWIKLGFEPPAFLIALGKITRRLVPGFTQDNGLDASKLSRDQEVAKAYEADQLVHTKITSATGIGVMESAEWLLKNTGKLQLPLLLMHGTKDQIISIEGSRQFVNKSSGDLTFKEWQGAYHEIHNETNKEDVFQYTLDWINDKV